MKGYKRNRLSRYVLAALTVGMFSLVPVAYALPVADTGYTNTSGSAINTSVANQLGITSTVANNVMNWKTFSIANGEKVQFDTNNYLNLVRGASKSEIDGTLSGGGNIYLINPNGILFGSTAQVNVGNLVASTRAITDADQQTFLDGGNPITTNTASSAAGDIINLGKLQTTKLVLEGNNITIQNAADITSDGSAPLTSAVTAKAAGIITVGHKVTETTTRSFTINGTATDKPVHDYKNATVANSGYTGKKLDGTTDNAIKEAMLVDNVYDLQNMDAKLDGNYMLAGDIDASDTKNWDSGAGFSPVGNGNNNNNNNFKGTFDGVNHTINGLYIGGLGTGLFGAVAFGSTVQNVGLVGGSITGGSIVGSVVGVNYGTISNVYNTGAVSSNDIGYVGGVVGANFGTISNAYNTGAVSSNGSVNGNVGGVVGDNFGTISNAYNTGAVSSNGNGIGIGNVGGVVGINGTEGTVSNTYNTGVVSGRSNVGGVIGVNNNDLATFINNWYATTNAVGNTINQKNDSGVGTARTLDELKYMDLSAYGFDANGNTAWRTYATNGSDTLVATTPMLQAFKSTALDDVITHDKVQYGTAESPLTNIYQTTGAVTLDYASLSLPGNVGAYISNNALTINNFTPGAKNTSSWGSGTSLTLQNDNGFIINKNMELVGTSSITMSAKDSSTGTIIDYGKNTTSTLNITAKDIVLDTDRVDTTAGNAKTAVTLNATGTAKAGYTPTGTMTATVNGASVSVPDYAHAAKRTYYPGITVNDGGAILSEGQWIKNVNELQAIGTSTDTLSKTYFLYGDIDASATKSWNKDQTTSVYQGFAPIGDDSNGFTGTFDGLNHTINGLTINRSSTDNVGLFGYVKQTYGIQDVGLVGGSIIGQNNVGGVIGYYESGTITNVYNTGAVSGVSNVGGVIGYYEGGTITNVYNTGAVSGTSSDVGGVAGYSSGTIKNVYNVGTVSGGSNVGGVLGYNSAGTITNTLWANDLDYTTAEGYYKPTQSVGNVADSGTGETLANMKKAKTYSNWTGIDAVSSVGNGGTAWRIYEGNTTPLLTSFFKGVVTATGLDNQTVTYNRTTQTADISGAVYSPADIDTSHIYAGSNRNAGTYSTIYSDQQGYDLVNEKTLTINPIVLTATLTGDNVFTKEYDGDTTVDQGLTLGSTYTLDKVVTGDTVSIATNTTGSYNNKNAGNGKTISYTGIALDGADAGNYTIADTLSGAVGKITQRDITPMLMGSNSFTKVYDGNNEVTAALTKDTNYQLINMVDKDDLKLTGTGIYTDKKVGNNKLVSFTGLSLTGDDAGNYNLTCEAFSSNVGQINKKTVAAEIKPDSTITKEYDGTDVVTTALAKDTNYVLTDVVSGDDLSLNASKASGTYTGGKNAGDKLNTKFIGLELTGADKDNYALKDDTMDGNYGKITPKTLMATLVGDNVFTKVYDGTTAVSQALTQGTNYTLDGIVADSDKVSLVGSGVYNDKNAGDNKTITFSGLALSGEGAGNYTIASTLSGNVGQITKKSLVAELNNGASFTKVYDGTTAVNTALVLDSNYAFAEGDVVTGDAVSIDAAKASGTYDSKDVGSNKQVNFTNLALTGADAGNYELFDMEMGITGASITPKALTATLTGDNAFTKVYDGTTTVSQALTQGTNYTLDGIVADSDKVLLSAGSGAYNDKNAGNNKTISFSGLTLTGTGAGNYTIASTMSGAVGQITRKTITGSLTSGYSFDKIYDGTTTATLGNGYTLNGVVTGDKVPLTAAKGFYDSSAIGDRTVTFSGFSINDGNYLLSMADSLSGTGKITSGSQDHNYIDALTGVSSYFGANPSDGYTIFSGSPEDYIPRAVTKNNGQSYQVGVSQVTQTWYNGPATITIINGGITLPKDILLGSTPDTRTVVIKGGTSN